MKYAIIFLLLALSQCGRSTECINSPLVGLWYVFNNTGHNFWFKETCEVKINGCTGYKFQDMGGTVKFIEDEFWHSNCNFPITNGPEEPYQIIGNQLLINNFIFRRY